MPRHRAAGFIDILRRRPAGPPRRAVSGPGRGGAGSSGLHGATRARQARYFPGCFAVGRPAGVFLEALKRGTAVQLRAGALEPAFDAVLVVGAAEVVDDLGEVVSARGHESWGMRTPVA